MEKVPHEIVIVFRGAKQRCEYPKHISYSYYGGRGIKFCFATPEDLYKEVGDRPTGYLLDRIDNDKNYEPGNVKWSTPEESSANRHVRHDATGRSAEGIYWHKTQNQYLVYVARKYIGRRKTMEAALSFQQEYLNGTKT